MVTGSLLTSFFFAVEVVFFALFELLAVILVLFVVFAFDEAVVELWEVAVECFDAVAEDFAFAVVVDLLFTVVVGLFEAVVVLFVFAAALGVVDLAVVTLALLLTTAFEVGVFEVVTFVATIFRPLTLLPAVALGELFVAGVELWVVVAFLADVLSVVLVDFVVFGDLVLATDNLFLGNWGVGEDMGNHRQNDSRDGIDTPVEKKNRQGRGVNLKA
jgi:hypothetical protein